jgi:hypothetical protein
MGKMSGGFLAVPLLALSVGCGQGIPDGPAAAAAAINLPNKGQSINKAAKGLSGIGPGGGSVDHLFFAVVGDTRPSLPDIELLYPTAIIDKIYADIEAMSPRPQFVVGTGDYMFAVTDKSLAEDQINLYTKASSQFSGTLFAAMGNHECNGLTNSNCTGTPTANFTAFMQALVTPLGQSLPYYSVPITATDGSWTAKMLIIACNSWNATQQSWLTAQLATPTTYTILVRHENAASNTGPCVNEVESLMTTNPYNLSLVGHVHEFSVSGKEVIVGTGGAPLDSGKTYGYATVEQTASGFQVSEYDYATAAPVSTTTIPF